MKQEKDVFPDFLKAVGKNIKKKRKDRRLTMEKLGLEVGLTRMHIYRIEMGYNITISSLFKLMIALGASYDELLKYDHKFRKADLDRLVEQSKGNRKRSRK